MAKYECIPGFELLGDEERICLEDGQWSGTDPICGRKLAAKHKMYTGPIASMGNVYYFDIAAGVSIRPQFTDSKGELMIYAYASLCLLSSSGQLQSPSAS